MTNLNAVFQFGVDNGYLADNPFKDLAIKGIKNHSGSSSRRNSSVLSMRAEISKPKIYGVFLFILAFALVSCVHLDGRT